MARFARQGSALIVTMWVIIALTGLVLTLSFQMRTEAIAGANRLSQAQAESAERGAEQLLLSIVDTEMTTPGTMADIPLEARQIGDCYVWVITPDWQNADTITYGLTDEAGKLDLNTATPAMLLNLPGMTEDVRDCIVDWRDSGTNPSAQGAKDDYYLSLPDPYHCKNAPYESLEELLLVKGITRDLLYGYDRNRNGVIDPREAQSGSIGDMINSASDTSVGFAPFVTVYGVQASTIPSASSSTSSGTAASSSTTTPPANVNSTDTSRLRTALGQALSSSRADNLVTATTRELRDGPFTNVFDYYFRVGLTASEFTQVYPLITAGAATPSGTGGGGGATSQPAAAAPAPRLGKVNINTAPSQVLLCLPQLDQSDVDAIMAHRDTLTSSGADPTNLAWLVSTLTEAKVRAIGGLVSGRSSVYSGDVIAVSGDGRAFRRYRVVISAQTTPAKIISRQDLTSAGWPLPPEVRAMLRSGQGIEAPMQTSAKGGSAL